MNRKTDVFLTVWQSSVLKTIALGTVIYVLISLCRNIGREFSDCGKCVTNVADKYRELKS